MLVIYPQPASLTPITSDCARPNITERQRTSPHRNHVQCTVQPRRLPATAAVARILHERLVHDVMGSQDLAVLLLAVISWLQKRGGGQLLAGPLQLFDVPRTILVWLFAFSSFPARCCWLRFVGCDFIIYQLCTAHPQEMSLKSHFPLESKCLHNMANFGKRAYQKETLGAKTLKSNNM